MEHRIMAEQTIIRMTAIEYQQLPITNTIQELINGELIVPPSPMIPHQRIAGRLYTLIQNTMPNGEVYFAPMDVYFDDINVLQPDVFWVAEDSQCIERDGYFHGAPELVLEVHSPSTTKRDKQTKFTIFEKHGVTEYWMADPVGAVLEVWQRKDQSFQRLGVFGEGDTFISSALEKEIVLKGVFRT
jgi:Uma2 family endonuclease